MDQREDLALGTAPEAAPQVPQEWSQGEELRSRSVDHCAAGGWGAGREVKLWFHRQGEDPRLELLSAQARALVDVEPDLGWSEVRVCLARDGHHHLSHHLSGCTLWGIGSSSDLRAEPARLPRVTCGLHVLGRSSHSQMVRRAHPPSLGTRGHSGRPWVLPSVFPRGGRHMWPLTQVQEPCWRQNRCRWLRMFSRTAFPLQGAGLAAVGKEVGAWSGGGSGVSSVPRTWPLASTWSPRVPLPGAGAGQTPQRVPGAGPRVAASRPG